MDRWTKKLRHRRKTGFMFDFGSKKAYYGSNSAHFVIKTSKRRRKNKVANRSRQANRG